METGITALYEEIERLNIIISALAEQNRQLKAEISSLKQIINSGNASIYSSGKIAHNQNTAPYSFDEKQDGRSDIGSALSAFSNGINQSIYSTDKIGNGITGADNSIFKNSEGISKVGPSFAEKNEGIRGINIAFVKQDLRKPLPKRSYATIDKAAKIIMLLNENPKQSHKTLMRLTGLSQDGMAKHIMMLKRKGLVVRTAFQTYTLTEVSRNIIKNAMR